MEIKVRKYKKDLNYSYCIGVFPTLELIKYRKAAVRKILIHSKGEKNDGVKKLQSYCLANHIPTEIGDKQIFNISNSNNCYAIGIFSKFSSKIDKQSNNIVLNQASDMGNVGSIMRSMVAFDCYNLALIKPSVDIFDPKIIRSSMGAVFQINVEYFTSLPEYFAQTHNNSYLFTLKGDNLAKIKIQTPFSLVFGNEGFGIEKDNLKFGQNVSIPYSNKVDSLNLSVAVGISLYSACLNTD